MLEFDGLWKQQNNPASNKSVKSLLDVEMLKLDTIRKKKKGLLGTATSTFTQLLSYFSFLFRLFFFFFFFFFFFWGGGEGGRGGGLNWKPTPTTRSVRWLSEAISESDRPAERGAIEMIGRSLRRCMSDRPGAIGTSVRHAFPGWQGCQTVHWRRSVCRAWSAAGKGWQLFFPSSSTSSLTANVKQ